MFQLEWNNRIGVFGTSGTGKSWLMKWIIKQYIKHNKRRYYVIIDDNIRNVKEYQELNFKLQAVNRSMINQEYNFKSFIKYHEKVCFIFDDLLQEEIKEFLNKIGYALYSLTDSLLAVDESHYFLTPGKNEPSEILRYERGGRKQGSDFILSTHRTTDISPDFINLLNVKISFRVNEINTIERLSMFYDQFNNVSNNDLIDPELTLSQKKQAKKIIKCNSPSMILKNLPNRFFLYSDSENGIQEISTSNILNM